MKDKFCFQNHKNHCKIESKAELIIVLFSTRIVSNWICERVSKVLIASMKEVKHSINN